MVGAWLVGDDRMRVVVAADNREIQEEDVVELEDAE